MVNNCLVTKLKGIVENDNLPFFEGSTITISSNITGGEARRLILQAYSTGSVILDVKIGHLVDGTQTEVQSPVEIAPGTASTLYAKEGEDVKVVIKNKYNIHTLTVNDWVLNLEEYTYCNPDTFFLITAREQIGSLDTSRWTNLRQIQGRNFNLNTDKLLNCNNLRYVNVNYNKKFVGEISNLQDTGVEGLNLYQAGVSGSALIFADNTKFNGLTSLDIRGTSLTDRTAETKALIEAAHPGITVQL